MCSFGGTFFSLVRTFDLALLEMRLRAGGGLCQSMIMTMLVALVAPYTTGGLPPFALGMQGVDIAGGVADKRKRKRSRGNETKAHTDSVLSLVKDGVDTVVNIEQKIGFSDLPQSEENTGRRKQRIQGILKNLETKGQVETNGKSGRSVRWKLLMAQSPCTCKIACVCAFKNICFMGGGNADLLHGAHQHN